MEAHEANRPKTVLSAHSHVRLLALRINIEAVITAVASKAGIIIKLRKRPTLSARALKATAAKTAETMD